jgi:hypothetical protein
LIHILFNTFVIKVIYKNGILFNDFISNFVSILLILRRSNICFIFVFALFNIVLAKSNSFATFSSLSLLNLECIVISVSVFVIILEKFYPNCFLYFLSENRSSTIPLPTFAIQK